jgi:hypothetical protein
MHDDSYRPDRSALVCPGAIDCRARDMSATIAADVPLGVVQERLRPLDQWLPIDGDPALPVGRLVEGNSTGPLRLGYGAWRDLLLGCQFTNGSGRLISAGGMTVKNVAGYDLTKFMVGQNGVFGRIVTITTRTWRRPTHALVASFSPSVRLIRELIPSPCRPQWAILTPEQLRCGYLGDDATISYYTQALRAYCPVTCTRRSLDEDVADRVVTWRIDGGPAGLSARIAVPPMKILDFVRQAGLRTWVADAAFGVILAGLPGPDVPHGVRDAARAMGGRVTAWSADGKMFADTNRPAELRLLRRLKEAFDVEHQLAPLPGGEQ